MSLGKKYRFAESNDSGELRSVCLLICQSGCTSAANSRCKCSKSSQKASSYRSKWNALHLDWVAPDGG